MRESDWFHISRDKSLTMFTLLRISVLLAFGACWIQLGSSKTPNIVLILTDDQDDVLEGEKPMAFTTNFFQTRGAHLKNFHVNTPVCCPSRATLISGRYPHNFLDQTGGGCMHMNVSNYDFSNRSIGMYMKSIGYTSGQFGKYLNINGMDRYCKDSEGMPGFDEWLTCCSLGKYFKNEFAQNNGKGGSKVWQAGDSPHDYLTSLIGNASISFIKNALKEDKPFFAYIAPHAPHLPATPAPWYNNTFNNFTAPRTPSYNYTALDHHWVIRQQEHLTGDIESIIDELYRNRFRTLLSVDDIMIAITNLLQDHNELDNTYFIWTSDHGYQLGQFNLPCCKLQPYEHDIHVTFRIAGPGVPSGKDIMDVVSMVDVAPTLIELGGGTPPKDMDGMSFANLFTKHESRALVDVENTLKLPARDRSIIEFWSLGEIKHYGHLIDGPNNTFIGVRVVNDTHNLLYVEFYPNLLEKTFGNQKPVEYEFYDLSKDFYQMRNLYGQQEYAGLISELATYLHQKVLCSGVTCRDTYI